MPDAQGLFKRHFGYTPAHVVQAPGRLELLGNHTDYNQGLVMSVAVNKYIQVASAPRSDGKIELVSAAFPQRELFWMSDLKKNPAAPWADYVKGVLHQLRKHGVNFSGFTAAIDGDIPAGIGMGSSGALEVATTLTVRRLYPFALTESGATVPPKRDAKGQLPPLEPAEKMSLARLCQAAENQFVGVPSGLLDQMSSLFGKAWHVMNLDFRFLSVEHAPIIGETVVFCDSGVNHALVSGQYRELRQICESAAGKLGARALRSVDLKFLKAHQSKLTAREYECAYHVVGEIQRVAAAERALRQDDHRQLGQYMYQSHESSRDWLKNSTGELDLLVELARAHPGCLGARMTGGGFGGATVNLVAYHQAESFMTTIARQYEERTGQKLQPVLCQIVDGAG